MHLNYFILKVVHIIEALGGGVYTYFKDLSFFFGDNGETEGIETYIIYSAHRREIDPEKVKSEFSPKVHLIEISMPENLSPVKDFKAVIALYKELKKINPDAIHLHSSKAGVLGRAAHFLLFNRKKLFYTPHGYSFLKTDIPQKKRKFFKLIEKYSQRLLGGTTIACGDTEFEIAKTLGKSELVRNGISISNTNPPIRTENKRLLVGIVGRITFQKAPELFNAIAMRFPDMDFLWIGDGDMRASITAPNITVTGWLLSQGVVTEYLSGIDVYLQTSLWEGLPIAVLEAMALQKPVVATNVIGNKDIVLQGETGFLFDDISELDEYFSILKDPEMREKFGTNGFERCKDVFDKNKNFKQLADLYKSYP